MLKDIDYIVEKNYTLLIDLVVLYKNLEENYCTYTTDINNIKTLYFEWLLSEQKDIEETSKKITISFSSNLQKECDAKGYYNPKALDSANINAVIEVDRYTLSCHTESYLGINDRQPRYFDMCYRDKKTILSKENKTLECIQKIKFKNYPEEDYLLIRFKDGSNEIIQITKLNKDDYYDEDYDEDYYY